MRTILAFVGAAVVAALFWFLRGSSDATVLAAKDAQIAAMQETARVKDHLASDQAGELDARTASLKELQNKLKSTADLLTKAQSQLDFDKEELQRVKTADETIINSLKEDNNADIQVLKEQIQDKNDQIAQLNEKLVQTIADYEGKLSALGYQGAETAADSGPKIYPKDNGFESQDLGAGAFAYQIFGTIWNPNGVPQPPQIPNKTPWTFGGGNSGITANGAFCMSNAVNGNSDGATSQSGQAAYLQTDRSWMSQTIELPAGTYSIGFDYEARPQYGTANQITVSLDGKELFKGLPADASNFAHVTTQTITFTKAGKYELKFRGLGAPEDPDGDHTTFIDNVCINVIDPHKHAANKAADNAPNPQPTIKEIPSPPPAIPDVIQNSLSVTKAERG
jgi:hypothetical protein